MSSKDSMPIAMDAIMQRMWTVFGVSEQATLLFLVVKMGCSKHVSEHEPSKSRGGMVGIRPKKRFHAQSWHSLLCVDLTKLVASGWRSFVEAFAAK
jgi:hypothetical protein